MDIIFGSKMTNAEFIQKLMKSVEKIKNIQTNLKEEIGGVRLECLIDGKSKVKIALEFQQFD